MSFHLYLASSGQSEGLYNWSEGGNKEYFPCPSYCVPLEKQRWACCRNLHTSVTRCSGSNRGIFHNPASVGGKEAALITREPISAQWATPQRGAVGREKALQGLVGGTKGLGKPQHHAHPFQGARRGSWAIWGDPQILPAGSKCCWVEVAQLRQMQCQLHLLTRAGNCLISAITPLLASKPCAWGRERKGAEKGRKDGEDNWGKGEGHSREKAEGSKIVTAKSIKGELRKTNNKMNREEMKLPAAGERFAQGEWVKESWL